jgi:hypothetical protein
MDQGMSNELPHFWGTGIVSKAVSSSPGREGAGPKIDTGDTGQGFSRSNEHSSCQEALDGS